MAQLRKTEADVGPIKYVAELIYGSADTGIIDKAVRGKKEKTKEGRSCSYRSDIIL